jgi:hypothetical protein
VSTAHCYGSSREINLEISAFNDPLQGCVWMVSDPLGCVAIGLVNSSRRLHVLDIWFSNFAMAAPSAEKGWVQQPHSASPGLAK